MERLLGIVKVFIVVAGLVIVIGTAVLIWLLVQRGQTGSGPSATSVPVIGKGPSTAAAIIKGDLAVPPDAVVIDMQLDGTEALLLLRTVAGEEYLAVVDLASGTRRTLLRLVPEPR